MKNHSKYFFLISLLLLFSHHLVIAQAIYPLSTPDSLQTQQSKKDSMRSDQDTTLKKLRDPFTNFYTSKTSEIHSIGLGAGDKLSLWYYFMAPLIQLERIKFVSFGFGLGSKAINYLTYKMNGELVNDTERVYFFFLGGSTGLTFFITDRIFLHAAGGFEYWFGDKPSGTGYIYKYRDGYDGKDGFKPMMTIGLFSILPLSKYSTTSLGFAYYDNGYQYQSYSLVFTFY